MKKENIFIYSLLFISLWSNYRNFGQINGLIKKENNIEVKTIDKSVSENYSKDINLLKAQIKQISRSINEKSLSNEKVGVSKANSIVDKLDYKKINEKILEINEKLAKYERKFELLNKRILSLELNRKIIIKPYEEKTNK